jgi:hypothetical protein
MSILFCSYSNLQQVAKQLPDRPANHGLIWTADLLNGLRDDYIKGCMLHELCVKYGRTADSIIGKLSTMKLITYDQITGAYMRNVLIEPNQTSQPKKEETMSKNTTPLQNLTLLFGNDIKECSEADLLSIIVKCQNEINSFASIPRNKWTEKRAVELKAAIDAAVAELDTRVAE